jgi:DNA-binding response OmpR family regulator
MQRVLIIEDDPAMSEYMGEILRRAGFDVSAAFNGVTGLEALRSSPPDVAILDIFMPEKDGLEVLIELRRTNPELNVVITSGKQHLLSGSSLSLAEQLGANATLPKPFTPKELVAVVSRLAGVAPSGQVATI